MDQTLHQLPSHEIPTIIKKASVFGGKVVQANSRKNTSSPIDLIDVDTSGLIFIKLHEKLESEKGRPVSIKLNYRNVSFFLSSEDYFIEGHNLIGKLPQAAKAIATRGNERYAFALNSNITTSFHRVEKRNGSFDAEARLVDISKQGMGIILPDAQAQSLVTNDHIWIKSLNGLPLSKAILAIVVYTFERKYKNSSDLKLGVALNESIPEEIFAELQKLCRLVLKT
jgi:hypothetical protein